MSIMLGNGNVGQTEAWVERAATVRTTTSALPDYFTGDVYDSQAGSKRTRIYLGGVMPSGMGYVDFSDTSDHIGMIGVFKEDGTELKSNSNSITDEATWTAASGVEAGKKYIVKYKVKAQKKEIVVSGDTFPGTYYVTGDTYARSDVSGKDQFFQFIIPKAKMTAENTITLQAEGDPSTFSMNLTVLRPEDGDMMKLVQYDLA